MKIRKGAVLNLRDDLNQNEFYGIAMWSNDLKSGKVVVKSFDKLSGIIKLENDFQGNCYSKEMFVEFQ